MKKTIISYTSRKNASKTYTFVEDINDGTTAVLVDSEGNNHLYAMNTLRKTFKKSVEEVEVEDPKTEKEHPDGPRKNIKGDPTIVNDDEVVMRAFTGMVIGVFKIEKETKTTITVKTAKGTLKFDKETGIQVNPNKKKFANRIDV